MEKSNNLETTLLILKRNNKILLAKKKRGFGEGKYNGVGGKVEKNETPEEAMIREAQEEISITPTKYTKVGEVEFKELYKGKKQNIKMYLFLATEWRGEPKETEEMIPKWFDINKIPYDQMFEDDTYWLPYVLSEKKIKAFYEYDDNWNLLFYKIDEMQKKYKIREIENKDNKAVEDIIRKCLIEFGANHAGTAWADPNLGRFSEIYNTKGNKYWVAEDENGNIVGGVGIGKLDGIENVCELQKMYCLPEARGTGISHKLITIALDYAKEYYNRCYLETLENMVAAQKFYEKHGFKRIYEPIIKTEHFACDVRYIKELK